MASEIKNGFTLGILGAGTMGTAVLNSTLDALARNEATEGVPLPGRFLAAVSSEKSAARLREAYGNKIEVIVNDAKKLAKESDVIVLGVKPYMAAKVLNGVDCAGKPVISLLAGKTIADLRQLTGSTVVARAMTNTPAKVSTWHTVT